MNMIFPIHGSSLPMSLGLFLWPKTRNRLNINRTMLAMSAGLLVSILTWIFMFSIERYMSAAWLLGPSFLACLLAVIWPKILSHDRAILLSVVAALGLCFITKIGILRRVPLQNWSEPYLDVNLPDAYDYDDSIVLFAGSYPTAFLAPYFPENAILGHVVEQAWSRPALEHYRPLMRKMIWVDEMQRPIYIVLYDYENAADGILEHVKQTDHLIGDKEKCKRIRTNFSYDNGAQWKVCPLQRAERAPKISSR